MNQARAKEISRLIEELNKLHADLFAVANQEAVSVKHLGAMLNQSQKDTISTLDQANDNIQKVIRDLEDVALGYWREQERRGARQRNKP
jgi:ElaB/YqjD/DUF883 family membrane-anchored ribosome-binding protein